MSVYDRPETMRTYFVHHFTPILFVFMNEDAAAATHPASTIHRMQRCSQKYLIQFYD